MKLKIIKTKKNLYYLLFVILVFGSQISFAQDETVNINSTLITIPTTVLDRDGRYVTDLKKEGFQVFEDGVEQKIAFFEPTEKPFTIFFLFDRSGSMTFQLAEMVSAANVFVRQFRPDDELSAATFADYLDTLFPVTKIKELKKGIKVRQNRLDRNTLIYDAVNTTQKKIEKISGRKAVVLFSTGSGSGIDATAKKNLQKATEEDAVFYTIKFKPLFSEPPPYADKKEFYKATEEAENYMRDLADVTGGRSYRIEEIGDLEKTFTQITDELGQQYTLGYYPKQTGKTGERRQIKVKVNQPNLAVRARDSYVVK